MPFILFSMIIKNVNHYSLILFASFSYLFLQVVTIKQHSITDETDSDNPVVTL